MSDETNYDLTVEGAEDAEYLMFRLLRDVPEAKSYVDENGKATGNGYDWRDLETDMRAFSLKHPGVLFRFVERGVYGSDSFEYRHYFKGGNYAYVEPVVTTTWPEFNEGMLK